MSTLYEKYNATKEQFSNSEREWAYRYSTFFFKITTHLVQINIYKNDKIFTGIPETLALNFILVSVTKVKAAAFLLLDCSHVTATVFQIEIL